MKSTKKNPASPAYYTMSSDYTRGGPPGWQFLNYDTLQKDRRGITPKIGWPDGYLHLPRGPWRFPDYVETPRFLIARKFGRPPRDLETIDGIWIVSAAMKAVLAAVDPTACEFRACETFLTSNEPGPETWLCIVTRAFVGAVDPDASEHLDVRIGHDGLASYGMNPLSQVQFKSDIIGSAHLFHIAEMSRSVQCDQVMKDACKAAGLKGVLFRLRSKS